ncbi:hypothetical protein ANN_27778 [Periplaneta americana]|uniref:Uncharacterized protein n=1 Tax=Periplaneta americana TaxID=6978 RepID=A0ABQ8RV84_PERAM|nr:hypothetical protein ANN_27778 [Periplaneta americana]
MPPKNRGNEETMEEVARRVAMDVWQEDAMLQHLALLIKDSIVAELQSIIESNKAVNTKLQESLEERDKRIGILECQLTKKNRRIRTVSMAAMPSYLWCEGGSR